MKIRPVGAELFHADGQTDMTKLMVAFCNFAKSSKTGSTTKLLRHINKYGTVHREIAFSSLHICADLPWGPPSLSYSGYEGPFRRLKWPGR